MPVAVKFKIETDTTNAKTGIRTITGELNKLEKTSEKTSTSMAKGFIKAQLVIQGLKAGLKFAVDGLKEFEKETGKAQGFTQLSKTFKDLQLQIGSVLAPAVTQFANLVEANFDKIAAFVRTAVATIVNAFNGWLAIIAVLKIGFAEFAKGLNNILATMVGGLIAYEKMWVNLPGIAGEKARETVKNLEGLKGTLENTGKYWGDYSKKAQDELDKVVSNIEDVNRAARTGTKLKSGGADARKAAAEAAAKAAKEKAELQKKYADEFQKFNEALDANNLATAKINSDNLIKEKEDFYSDSLDAAKAFDDVTKENMQKSLNEYQELLWVQHDDAMEAINRNIEARRKAGENESLLVREQQRREAEENAEWNDKMAASDKKYQGKLKDLTEKETSENATTLKNAQANMARITEEIQRDSLSGRLKNVEDYSAKVLETYEAAHAKDLLNEEQYNTAKLELVRYTEDMKVQIIQESITKQIDAYVNLANMTVAIFENAATIRINQIERERKAEIKAVNGSVLSSKEKAEKVDEINKKMDEKIREQKKKEQGYAIASALIAGAVASMNMWQGAMQLGPIAGVIVGAIGQALLVALTATEVGVISSQEFARGGVVQGNPAAGDVQNVKATGGEVVMNRDQQARTLMAIANGGGGAGTPSIRGGDTYVTIQGNADEAILAEALSRSRMSQMQDMKQLLRQMQYNGSIRLAVA
jgi:hypothetical protein